MKIEIIELSRRPHFYTVCSKWAYRQWHKYNNTNYSIVEADYKRRAKNLRMPKTLIALHNNTPVGMVSLKKHDLTTRKDLSPWLSALYVDERYRNRGLGKILVHKVINLASVMNYKSIYLFADRNNAEELIKYYEKIGWRCYEYALDIQSNKVMIMKYCLLQREIH